MLALQESLSAAEVACHMDRLLPSPGGHFALTHLEELEIGRLWWLETEIYKAGFRGLNSALGVGTPESYSGSTLDSLVSDEHFRGQV